MTSTRSKPTIQASRDDLAYPEIYADDVSQVLMGVPVSKVVFHTVTGTGDGEAGKPDADELKRRVLQLAIPTASLLHFARNVLSSAGEITEQIDKAVDQYKQYTKKALDGVEISSSKSPKRARAKSPG